MDPLQTKAYGVYLTELAKHIAFFAENLASGHPTDPAISKKARIAAHNIKGGAGFFGLMELKDLASTLEEILLSGGGNAEQIRTLIQSIAQISKTLPPPQC